MIIITVSAHASIFSRAIVVKILHTQRIIKKLRLIYFKICIDIPKVRSLEVNTQPIITDEV